MSERSASRLTARNWSTRTPVNVLYRNQGILFPLPRTDRVTLVERRPFTRDRTHPDATQ